MGPFPFYNKKPHKGTVIDSFDKLWEAWEELSKEQQEVIDRQVEGVKKVASGRTIRFLTKKSKEMGSDDWSTYIYVVLISSIKRLSPDHRLHDTNVKGRQRKRVLEQLERPRSSGDRAADS